jgi:FkbM family methyltransferase
MFMNFKPHIYRFYIQILRVFWKLAGSRRIKAFGQQYRVAPKTVFPTYRHLRPPKGPYPSQIVRYTDFVQMHSALRYVAELNIAPLVIDVGAHHGAYAVILGKALQERRGKIIALEPNPESFTVLLENVKLNNLENTVICEQVAVMDKSGLTDIIMSGSESRVSSNQNSGTIEVTTIEKLIKKYEIDNIDLLIIDVEGAELPVLMGFPWESKRPGKIFCELHPYEWKNFGYSGEDLRLFLEDHQYRCFDVFA